MTSAQPVRPSLLVRPSMVGELMDHTPESAYAHLRATHPGLFVTPPGDGTIKIMRWPMVEGQVLHRDQRWMLLEDPVKLPDGRHGRCLRMCSPQPERGVAVLPLLDGEVVLIERFRHATRSWHWEVPRGFGTAGVDDAESAARQLQEETGCEVRELIALGTVHPDTGILAHPVALYAARIDTAGAITRAEGIRRSRVVCFAEADEMAADGTITDSFTIASIFRARRAGLAT